MGRKPGSLNKPKIEMMKNGNAVIKVKLDKQIESAPRFTNSNRGWVNAGQRNDFFLQLSNLYYNSPTNKSCIDFAVNAIVGEGVDYERMKVNDIEEIMPNYQETWEDFIRKIALDYMIYGSFAFQIIKNKDNKTYSVYHQSFSDVRCSPKDEDGVITSYFVSPDWTALGKYPPQEYPAFNFQEDEELAQGKIYLYVYQPYSPDIVYYQVPHYFSAVKAIQTEIEMLRYDLRSVLNNFSASGVLTMKEVDTDEEKKLVIDNIEAMFTGSDNANSLIINFVNNVDDKVVDFTSFDKAINNVNLFSENNDRTINRIISAHRIPTKQLIGYDADSAMLGGEGNLLNVAFNLYMKIIGNNNQKTIVNTINKIFKINGIDIQIFMKPLRFDVLQPTSIREENVNVDKEVYDTENVEEKGYVKESY